MITLKIVLSVHVKLKYREWTVAKWAEKLLTNHMHNVQQLDLSELKNTQKHVHDMVTSTMKGNALNCTSLTLFVYILNFNLRIYTVEDLIINNSCC